MNGVNNINKTNQVFASQNQVAFQQRNEATEKVIGLMKQTPLEQNKENVTPLDPIRVRTASTPRQELNKALKTVVENLPENEREATYLAFVDIFQKLIKDNQIDKFVVNDQTKNSMKLTLHLKSDLKGNIDPVTIYAKKGLQFTATVDPVTKKLSFSFDNSSLQIGKGFIKVDAPRIEISKGRATGVVNIGGFFKQPFDVSLTEIPGFLSKLTW